MENRLHIHAPEMNENLIDFFYLFFLLIFTFYHHLGRLYPIKTRPYQN